MSSTPTAADPATIFLGTWQAPCPTCGESVETYRVADPSGVYLERWCPRDGRQREPEADDLAGHLATLQTPQAAQPPTRALCNVCGRLTDAIIELRDGRVFLVKSCPDHGRTEALVSSDQGWYQRSLGYVKPGTRPVDRAVTDYAGCPTSCGLCPQHQQHSCLPIIEITSRCDLDCPICLVGEPGDRSAPQPPGSSPRGGRDLSLAEVEAILDDLMRYEGRLNLLNLSGGEPTLHPDLLAIVAAAQRREIGIVSLSTNGMRLLRDEDLIRALRDAGVVISLQFDGLRAETYATLRGRPELADHKRRLLDRLLELDARVSLTVTLARGVNEDELDPILRLLFEHDQILSVMVQPVAYAGNAVTRFPGDPLDRLTIPDVVALLATHSHGVLQTTDFTPLPCSHPTCFALTYLLKTERAGLIALPRIIQPDSYLDIIKNQALFNTDADTLSAVRDSLYALWTSDGVIPERDGVLDAVRQLLRDLSCLGAEACHRDLLDLGARRIKSVFIHHFMDRYNFDLSRAMKCCNHYPQADGRLLPACVRNNFPASALAGTAPRRR